MLGLYLTGLAPTTERGRGFEVQRKRKKVRTTALLPRTFRAISTGAGKHRRWPFLATDGRYWRRVPLRYRDMSRRFHLGEVFMLALRHYEDLVMRFSSWRKRSAARLHRLRTLSRNQEMYRRKRFLTESPKVSERDQSCTTAIWTANNRWLLAFNYFITSWIGEAFDFGTEPV